MISLSKASFFLVFSQGLRNQIFLDWLVKLNDNSFQTPYSVSMGNFFEVKFQLIMLWRLDSFFREAVDMPHRRAFRESNRKWNHWFEVWNINLLSKVYSKLKKMHCHRNATDSVEVFQRFFHIISLFVKLSLWELKFCMMTVIWKATERHL